MTAAQKKSPFSIVTRYNKTRKNPYRDLAAAVLLRAVRDIKNFQADIEELGKTSWLSDDAKKKRIRKAKAEIRHITKWLCDIDNPFVILTEMDTDMIIESLRDDTIFQGIPEKNSYTKNI